MLHGVEYKSFAYAETLVHKRALRIRNCIFIWGVLCSTPSSHMTCMFAFCWRLLGSKEYSMPLTRRYCEWEKLVGDDIGVGSPMHESSFVSIPWIQWRMRIKSKNKDFAGPYPQFCQTKHKFFPLLMILVEQSLMESEPNMIIGSNNPQCQEFTYQYQFLSFF